MMFFPYCERCAVFHDPTASCDEILERRAKVIPINIHQLRLDDLVTNAPLEDVLAESLRQRGIEPAHPSVPRADR